MLGRRKHPVRHFCGCCGAAIGEQAIWCGRCSFHVASTGPLWERTFAAINDKPCPFQLKVKS